MSANKSIKGTKTEANIVSAYMAESSAYTRYTFYAKKADTEGYYPIGLAFRNTAENELHHSKIFFKFLEGGQIACQLIVDAGIIGDTASNLKTAVEEEQAEGYDMYLAAAKTADEEGFPEIASHFRAIAEVERRHHQRFQTYLQQVQDGTVWKREQPIKWQCLVCGYVYEGTTPPQTCPGCDHPYQHYVALDMDNL